MTADINTAYQLIGNVFTDITIFNIGWILSIPLVLGTAWIITRDKDAQGFLWLPLTIAYHIIGVKPSFIWYIVATIVFVVKIFSADRTGNFLTTQIRQAFYETDYGKNKYYKSKIIEKIENEMTKRSEKSLEKISFGDLYESWKRGKGR